jgi:hypothetical protein
MRLACFRLVCENKRSTSLSPDDVGFAALSRGSASATRFDELASLGGFEDDTSPFNFLWLTLQTRIPPDSMS